jgi:hypothetical protein
MTLDAAIVKLSECFANGQVYTTVARAISIENLYIMDINFSKIKAIQLDESELGISEVLPTTAKSIDENASTIEEEI